MLVSFDVRNRVLTLARRRLSDLRQRASGTRELTTSLRGAVVTEDKPSAKQDSAVILVVLFIWSVITWMGSPRSWRRAVIAESTSPKPPSSEVLPVHENLVN